MSDFSLGRVTIRPHCARIEDNNGQIHTRQHRKCYNSFGFEGVKLCHAGQWMYQLLTAIVRHRTW